MENVEDIVGNAVNAVLPPLARNDIQTPEEVKAEEVENKIMSLAHDMHRPVKKDGSIGQPTGRFLNLKEFCLRETQREFDTLSNDEKRTVRKAMDGARKAYYRRLAGIHGELLASHDMETVQMKPSVTANGTVKVTLQMQSTKAATDNAKVQQWQARANKAEAQLEAVMSELAAIKKLLPQATEAAKDSAAIATALENAAPATE